MWLDYLVKARDIGTAAKVTIKMEGGSENVVDENQFVVEEFSAVTGLTPKDASAWLSKFVKWGYARRVGYRPSSGNRPYTVYAITEYGMKLEPKNLNRLTRLLNAVEKLRAASEDRWGEALRELFGLADEISGRKAKAKGKRIKSS